jgi:hypothetical protein
MVLEFGITTSNTLRHSILAKEHQLNNMYSFVGSGVRPLSLRDDGGSAM